jgi:hypothetical protein
MVETTGRGAGARRPFRLPVGGICAYPLRAAHRITRDHSLVQVLVENGTISEVKHPPSAGHCHTRAAGADTTFSNWTSEPVCSRLATGYAVQRRPEQDLPVSVCRTASGDDDPPPSGWLRCADTPAPTTSRP